VRRRYVIALVRLPAIKAERARTQLGDEQSTADHGQVFHEHDHLHLRHPWIGYGPEFVHHQCDRDQKEHDQPGAYPGPIAEQDTHGAGECVIPDSGTAIEASGTPCDAA
jgi:hypothetical protein